MAAPELITITAEGLADPEMLDNIRAIEGDRGPERPLSFGELRELDGRARRFYRARDGGGGSEGAQDGHTPRQKAVGGVVLRTPTLGARMLLDRVQRWYEAGELRELEWLTVATAYACAIGYDREALQRANVPTWAELLVQLREWAATVACTVDDLDEATADLALGMYPETPDEGGEPDADPTIGPASC